MMLFGLRVAPPDWLVLQLGEDEDATLRIDWVEHQALWWDPESQQEVPHHDAVWMPRKRQNRWTGGQ